MIDIRKLVFILFFPAIVLGQDLEKIGKSALFKLTGGIAANGIYYSGDSNRSPFTYILSGNLNINISGVYNIPLSFSYSDAKFQKNNPFSFNRLSLHPSYKWVTAHIGDVSMSFSPYTLSGHQFTGVGFDVSPGDKFKVSVMYGRLLEAREYDEENSNGAAIYKRNGYGFKTSYKFDKGALGVIFFKAKDEESSLKKEIPTAKDIQPKENAVISLEGNIKATKELSLKAEMAVSILTEDIRSGKGDKSLLDFLVNTNVTTQYYRALNFNVNYQIGKGEIGVGYERIDPNYKTLGGYYFNNDLENITVNASQRVFKDKLSIAVNAGLQKDDLDNSKTSKLRRLVMSLNTSYTPSDKLAITAGYSSFQSFTNIKNQFDYINEVSKVENQLDKANISQISQNSNLNVNYVLKESKLKRENLNLGLNYQNAVNKVEDGQTPDEKSSFYNGNIVYTIGYLEKNLTISGAINASVSKLVQSNTLIIGPTISANKSFFDKKLKVSSAISYNQSKNNGVKQGDITNLRLGARYVYKKRHNFSLNFLNQYRKSASNSKKDLTITFGYNYSLGSFSSKNIKFKKKAKKSKKRKKGYEIKFVYKDSLYQGTIPEIDSKLARLTASPLFKDLPSYKKEKLAKYRAEILKEDNKKAYKIKAIQYLKDLYDLKDYATSYNALLFSAMKDLLKDAKKLDYKMEKDYVEERKKMIDHELRNKTLEDRKTYSEELQKGYKVLERKEKKSLEKLITHRWIVSRISSYKTISDISKSDQYLDGFFKQEGESVYKMLDNKEDKSKIKLYLLYKVIDFYAKKAKKHANFNTYELKYMYKK